MTYLPMQNTSVPVAKSMAEIQQMLIGAGFESVMQGVFRGQAVILAEYRGAAHRFIPNTGLVKEALRAGKLYYDEERTERIAWRLIWQKVKSDCDVLKYQAVPLSTVFGGFLIMRSGNTLGEYIEEKVSQGQLNSSDILSPLLIENKG